MSSFLAAVRLVLKDVASLGSSGNKALVAALAAGVVAIVAAVLGVSLTTAEVTGAILLVASLAAALEKLPVVNASK